MSLRTWCETLASIRGRVPALDLPQYRGARRYGTLIALCPCGSVRDAILLGKDGAAICKRWRRQRHRRPSHRNGWTLMARLWDLKPGWTLHWLEDGDNIACDDCGHCLLFLPTMSEGDVATAVVEDHDAYHLIMTSVKSKNNRSRKAIKVDLDGWHRS